MYFSIKIDRGNDGTKIIPRLGFTLNKRLRPISPLLYNHENGRRRDGDAENHDRKRQAIHGNASMIHALQAKALSGIARNASGNAANA